MIRVPLVAAVIASASSAFADTPVVLSHAGYLLEGSDKPVTEASANLGFSIWTDATSSGAASKIWPASGESACRTPVRGGYYGVALDGASSGCGAGLTAELLTSVPERYLQVSVDGVALTPRMRIGNVPTAAIATKSLDTAALTLLLAKADGSVNTTGNPVDWSQLKGVPAGLADGTDDGNTYADDGATLDLVSGKFGVRASGIGEVQLQTDAVTTTKIKDAAITAAKLAQDGAALAKVSGGALLLAAVDRITSSASIEAAKFVGDGSGLTHLSSAALTGQIPSQLLPSTLGGTLTGTFSGALTAGTTASTPTADAQVATKAYVDAQLAKAASLDEVRKTTIITNLRATKAITSAQFLDGAIMDGFSDEAAIDIGASPSRGFQAFSRSYTNRSVNLSSNVGQWLVSNTTYWTYSGSNIERGPSGSYEYSMASNDAFSGNQDFAYTMTPRSNTDDRWMQFGFVNAAYNTASTYNNTYEYLCASYPDTWYFMHRGIGTNNIVFKYGCTTVATVSQTIAAGDVFTIARDNGTIRAYRNSTLLHTWTQTSTSQLRRYLGHGFPNGGAMPLWQDVRWGTLGSDLTLVSAPQTVAAPNDRVQLLVIHQAVASGITLNTDVKLAVSRNDGVNYASATLVDAGPWDAAGRRLLYATVDLSAEPAGTKLRWKLTTHNQKEQSLHGVAMYWK